MSELDKILDAVSLLQDFSLAQSGDISSLDKLLKREGLPENIKIALAKLVKKEEPPKEEVCPECGKPMKECSCGKEEVKKEAEPIEEIKMTDPVITKRYGKPVRDEYKTDEEFAKALKEYEGFVNEISDIVRKAIEAPMGEAIKKSLVPERIEKKTETVDFMKVRKSASESRDLTELLFKEGIKL